MRVEWAVLARFAEDHDGLVSISSAGLDAFFVPEFPAVVQFFLVVKLRCRDDQAGRDHRITIDIKGPDLATVGTPVEFSINPERGEMHPDGWEIGLNLIMPSTVSLEQAGAHSVHIHVHDGRGWDVPFLAVQMGT